MNQSNDHACNDCDTIIDLSLDIEDPQCDICGSSLYPIFPEGADMENKFFAEYKNRRLRKTGRQVTSYYQLQIPGELLILSKKCAEKMKTDVNDWIVQAILKELDNQVDDRPLKEKIDRPGVQNAK